MASGDKLNGGYASFFGPDPLQLLFVVLLTSLGTWGLPQMIGKFYSIKNEGSIKKGTIISTFFAVVVAGGCYFLGGFGRLFGNSEAIKYSKKGKILFDSIIPAMLSELPAVIISIVIVLVLAASMSTLSSLVLTSSSTLTLDVIAPASKEEMSEKKKVGIMRLFIIFFVLVSAVLAVLKDSLNITFIAQMMGVSWGAMAGAFLAPFMYGLYSKRVTKPAVAVSFIFAIGMTIMQLLVSFGTITLDKETVIGYIFKSSINSGVVAMVGGLLIVPLISLFTKKPDPAVVNDAFSSYEKTITVKAKDSLNYDEEETK
jgi:SSS family solute:Na+ symporter